MGKTIGRDKILGLPIINDKTGERIGVVEDIYYDNSAHNIEGIILTKMGIRIKSYLLDFHKIDNFGKTSIRVKNSQMEEIKEGEQENILGKTIALWNGKELGVISDIIFNPEDGKIEGFEISQGFIDDLIVGRSILLSKPSWNFYESDYILAYEDDIEIKSANRGILNILERLKE